MDLSTALRSTAAIRSFEDRAVSDATLDAILETARFAPSGGNRQGWRVIIVKDEAKRTLLRDAYLPGWYEYLAQGAAGLVPWAPVTDLGEEAAAIAQAPQFAAQAAEGPGGFAEHLDKAPVLLLLIADLRYLAAVDRDSARYSFAGGGSIYPFAWSVLLAAREHGIGGVLTTMVVRSEDELRSTFGMQPHHALAGLMALGYPTFQPSTLRRAKVAAFTTIDGLDGEPFEPQGRS